MAQVSMRTVNSGGGDLCYRLEIKPVKNVNLRVKGDGTVWVSAASRVPVDVIDRFVAEKADFIRAAQARAGQRRADRPKPRQYITGETLLVLGEPRTLRVEQARREEVRLEGGTLLLRVKDPENRGRKDRLLAQYADRMCLAVFGRIMADIYPLFRARGVAEPKLRLRDMKTRWGSCTPGKGAVTLNKQLLAAPVRCIEYVAMHEYCHFIHPNHSPRFYGLLASLMPDWQERKAELERVAAAMGPYPGRAAPREERET